MTQGSVQIFLLPQFRCCAASISIGESCRRSISEILRFHTDLTSGAALRAARSAGAPKRSSQALAGVMRRLEVGTASRNGICRRDQARLGRLRLPLLASGAPLAPHGDLRHIGGCSVFSTTAPVTLSAPALRHPLKLPSKAGGTARNETSTGERS
jgi:hypothetical protein